MRDNIYKIEFDDFPPLLKEINDPPGELYLKGDLPDPTSHIYLAVVGSRHHSSYGKEACEYLIDSLRGLPVVIVSGLALGIDSIAHATALKSGIKTVAIPGSGLNPDSIYPRMHQRLAQNIVESGGTLVSELTPDTKAAPWTFPRRNRIMAGLSNATLVIEAREKSGTLITARLAMEYNRDVLVLPGSIFNPGSIGPLKLLKDGATPILNGPDLKDALGFKTDEKDFREPVDMPNLSLPEQEIYKLLSKTNLPRTEIFIHLKLPTEDINTALTMLELRGVITETAGEMRLI